MGSPDFGKRRPRWPPPLDDPGDHEGPPYAEVREANAPDGKMARLEIAKKGTPSPPKIAPIKANKYQWNQQNGEKSEKIGTVSKPIKANADSGHK